MGHEGQEIFLKDMLVFLFAAGVIVPAFRILKLPAVAGFLIAGVALGPHGLSAPMLSQVEQLQPTAFRSHGKPG